WLLVAVAIVVVCGAARDGIYEYDSGLVPSCMFVRSGAGRKDGVPETGQPGCCAAASRPPIAPGRRLRLDPQLSDKPASSRNMLIFPCTACQRPRRWSALI